MRNTIEYWNQYVKPSKEVDVEAVPGDIVIEIGGILFLVQRTNDANNIVCFRTKETNVTLEASFRMLRQYLLAQNIIYIRVEGNKHRYNWLSKVDVCEGFNVLKEDRDDRNVFYIKLI